jgi:hypothetical protein
VDSAHFLGRRAVMCFNYVGFGEGRKTMWRYRLRDSECTMFNPLWAVRFRSFSEIGDNHLNNNPLKDNCMY